jgi:hypothetical protein
MAGRVDLIEKPDPEVPCELEYDDPDTRQRKTFDAVPASSAPVDLWRECASVTANIVGAKLGASVWLDDAARSVVATADKDVTVVPVADQTIVRRVR